MPRPPRGLSLQALDRHDIGDGRAGVVKLVDAPDSKSGSERSVGSSPTTRTIRLRHAILPPLVAGARVGMLLGRAVDPEAAQIVRYDFVDLLIGQRMIAPGGEQHAARKAVEAAGADLDR